MTDHTAFATSVAAVEAARAAFSIAGSYESSGPIVLRTVEFSDAQAAVSAALSARNIADYPRVLYRSLAIKAGYDSTHGLRVELDGVDFGDDGKMLVVVVTMHSILDVFALTKNHVFEEIRRQINDVNEDSDFAPYISEVIFIIEELPV